MTLLTAQVSAADSLSITCTSASCSWVRSAYKQRRRAVAGHPRLQKLWQTHGRTCGAAAVWMLSSAQSLGSLQVQQHPELRWPLLPATQYERTFRQDGWVHTCAATTGSLSNFDLTVGVTRLRTTQCSLHTPQHRDWLPVLPLHYCLLRLATFLIAELRILVYSSVQICQATACAPLPLAYSAASAARWPC